jgi:SAM-dependent methyltransferase
VLDVVKEKNVLDVACGEGYGSFFMAEIAASVVGVDISDETVHQKFIMLATLFKVDRAIWRGDNKNPIRSQYTSDFCEHLSLLNQVLNCFEGNHYIE